MLFEEPFIKSAVQPNHLGMKNADEGGALGTTPEPAHADASQSVPPFARRHCGVWRFRCWRFVSRIAEMVNRWRSAAPARFFRVCCVYIYKKKRHKSLVGKRAEVGCSRACVCTRRFCCVGILRLCGWPHQYSPLTWAAPLRLCS